MYSSQAIYLALQKPLFGLWIPLLFFCVILGVSINQILQQQVAFVIPNIAIVIWMALSLFCTQVLGSTKAAFRVWIFGCFSFGAGFLVGNLLDKMVDNNVLWADSKLCVSVYNISPHVDPRAYVSCVAFQYVYSVYNAMLGFTLAISLIFCQKHFWRIGFIGFSVRVWMTTAYDYSANQASSRLIFISLIFPVTLIFTETLRIYGKLQALQIANEDEIALSNKWNEVTSENSKSRLDLDQMAQKLNESFDSTVLDHSVKMGAWITKTIVSTKPPPIHQPINDFDELYSVASIVNNTFQIWIESFFGCDQPSASFLYLDELGDMDNLQDHLRFESFHGVVSRGPVKLPERAIAKVSHIHLISLKSIRSL
jgi:hypothetical protein